MFQSQWQQIQQYWHCLKFGFYSGFNALSYGTYTGLTAHQPLPTIATITTPSSAFTPPTSTLWIDLSPWSMASISQGNQFYPFETPHSRFTATVVEALLALPKHPELPNIAVGAVTQHISQLAGVIRYAKRAFNQANWRNTLIAQWFGVQCLPYQETLTKKRQQLETLALLLNHAELPMKWHHAFVRGCLNTLFGLADLVFQGLQRKQLQQTPNSYGVCFGLLEFLNSPLNEQTRNQPIPIAIYCSTDFDTQLLVDEHLHPFITEILPEHLTETLTFIMPSVWHKNTFLTLFPFVPAHQVQYVPPCVDSFFRLSEVEQAGLTRFIQQTSVLKKLGIEAVAKTPFFLVVLDKQQSFRWLHSVLAGFECFYDIRIAESKLTAVEHLLTEQDTEDTDKETAPASPDTIQPTLVIVGAAFEELPAYQALVKETVPDFLQDCIHLHGGVSAASLLALYHQALGLFYVPDEKELGLGLPVLEALTMQCPVVVSKVAHLEAFAENAALFVAPHEPLQLAFAMAQLVEEQKLLRALRHNGRKRTLLQRETTFVQALLHLLKLDALAPDTNPTKYPKSTLPKSSSFSR